jgi:hypothetical protein
MISFLVLDVFGGLQHPVVSIGLRTALFTIFSYCLNIAPHKSTLEKLDRL